MNSNAKGKRGERAWRDFLRKVLGFAGAKRRQQYCGTAGDDDVDDTMPETYCEVKNYGKQVSLYPVIEEATKNAGGLVVYIAHRISKREKSGKVISKPWLVTMYAKDLVKFAEALLNAIEKEKDDRKSGYHATE